MKTALKYLLLIISLLSKEGVAGELSVFSLYNSSYPNHCIDYDKMNDKENIFIGTIKKVLISENSQKINYEVIISLDQKIRGESNDQSISLKGVVPPLLSFKSHISKAHSINAIVGQKVLASFNNLSNCLTYNYNRILTANNYVELLKIVKKYSILDKEKTKEDISKTIKSDQISIEEKVYFFYKMCDFLDENFSNKFYAKISSENNIDSNTATFFATGIIMYSKIYDNGFITSQNDNFHKLQSHIKDKKDKALLIRHLKSRRENIKDVYPLENSDAYRLLEKWSKENSELLKEFNAFKKFYLFRYEPQK